MRSVPIGDRRAMSAPEQPDQSQQHDEQEGQDGQVSELAMEGTDPKEVSPEEPAVGEPAKPDADPAQGGTL